MLQIRELDEIQKRLLREVADLHNIPEGAYNIRANGQSAGRQSSANIDIVPKEGGSGLDIYVKPGTKNESVHIPVVMTQSGLTELVYNDFHIGEGADVFIVAGCGIDNCGNANSEHDGIHRFYVGKNAKVKYVEKHYGSGDGTGKRILNPGTEVYMEENSTAEMEMVQIKGVDSTERTTTAELAAGAKLVVRERLMTHGNQYATSKYVVNLNGEGASADVVSRSVARDHSYQKLDMVICDHPDILSLKKALENGEPLTGLLGNSLEQPALLLNEDIRKVKERLEAYRCGEVLMSGSGSTVFCISEEEREIKAIYEDLRGENLYVRFTVTL